MVERTPHVLLVHQLFVLGKEAGGTRHVELAGELAARGARVTVIAATTSYLTGAAVGGAGEVAEPMAGVRVLRAGSVGAGAGFAARLASFLSFALSSFRAGLRVPAVDVVWGTSPPLFQAQTAWQLARVRRVPFVLEIRDLWPDFAVELGILKSPPLIGAARALERFLYRRADRLVLNSPGFVDHVVARGARPERVAVIPNGVDVGPFDPAARGEGFRREVGARPDTVLVVYAGAHGIPNDLGVLLDAAERMRGEPRVRFALVGGGRDRERLIGRARSLGLDNVVFADAVAKERIPEVLAAADVCVATLKPLPLFATTYPNKVFDYMAAGRPVVLAIDGVIRRVVEEAGAGTWVPPGDGAALARAIAAYARDPERRGREGAAGRAFVAARFRRELQGEALRALFSELLAERAAGR